MYVYCFLVPLPPHSAVFKHSVGSSSSNQCQLFCICTHFGTFKLLLRNQSQEIVASHYAKQHGLELVEPSCDGNWGSKQYSLSRPLPAVHIPLILTIPVASAKPNVTSDVPCPQLQVYVTA